MDGLIEAKCGRLHEKKEKKCDCKKRRVYNRDSSSAPSSDGRPPVFVD